MHYLIGKLAYLIAVKRKGNRMAAELMTTAVCWDMDMKVSARFARDNKDFFYFCPDCLEKVDAKISERGNFFFRAPNKHQEGCANEKAQSDDSAVSGERRREPAYVPPPLTPSHLGKIALPRKKKQPSPNEMRELVNKIKAAPVLNPGTLAEVVDAWSSMTASERHQTPLSIAGQLLNYFTAFAEINPFVKNVSSLGCKQVITYTQATISFSSRGALVVTWRKFSTQNKPVPIRAEMAVSDPAVKGLTKGQHVKLFLHGPAPTLNADQTYFEMQNANEYSGFIVRV